MTSDGVTSSITIGIAANNEVVLDSDLFQNLQKQLSPVADLALSANTFNSECVIFTCNKITIHILQIKRFPHEKSKVRGYVGAGTACQCLESKYTYGVSIRDSSQ